MDEDDDRNQSAELEISSLSARREGSNVGDGGLRDEKRFMMR